MGKSRAKLSPFVAISWKMLNSKACIKLKPTARGLLPYFLGKVKLPNTDPAYYHAHFTFTFSEAQKYGCARRSFFRVIENLMAHGFIDPVSKGKKGPHATPNIFRLSRRWENYDKPDYKPVSWRQFGQEQIQRQVQNWHNTVAKSKPAIAKGEKYVCQK